MRPKYPKMNERLRYHVSRSVFAKGSIRAQRWEESGENSKPIHTGNRYIFLFRDIKKVKGTKGQTWQTCVPKEQPPTETYPQDI